MNLTEIYSFKRIEFSHYSGVAGDPMILLSLWIDGKFEGRSTYNRSWPENYRRNRAMKKLFKEVTGRALPKNYGEGNRP